MADVEMTTEEIIGLETAKIAQMELKDGTIVMIKNEEEVQPQEEVAQEEAQEVQQEEVAENAENVEGQENQLRARPGFPHMRPAVVPMRPAVVPMRPAVVPMRPAVVPRPLIAPRGPMVRPMAPMGVFRARPGMPIHRPPVVAPKVVPVPMHRPVVPVPVPVHRPMVPGKPGMLIRPAVAPMPIARPVFRARPNTEPEAEEAEYQEEEYNGEEQYCECEEGQEGQEEQVDNLRARPMMMMPMGPRMRPPMMRPRPPVPVVPIMPPRRGPMMGFNTFQPRVFRARPGPRVVPTPMFVPVNPTFQPKVVRGPVPPPMHHPHMHPMRPHVFRGKEMTNNCEEEQQCENQCTKSVCTKCGKEF